MVSDIPGTTRDAIDTTFTDADGTRYNICLLYTSTHHQPLPLAMTLT